MDIQALQQKIKELETKLNQLSQSSTIPRNVETALRERLGIQLGSTAIITYVASLTQDGITKVVTPVTKTLTFTNGYLTSYT